VNETQPDTLQAALARHAIVLPDDEVTAIDRYCRALWRWNEKLNLTRHTTYEKFVARDLVDCLALERLLDAGDRVLDVGTGGGVPGAVLAIVRPDLEVELCDSVAKKAKAAAAIVAEAVLNVPVHHAPVQELLARENYNTLVVRAVAPLAKLLGWLKPHWESFDRLLVIKGPAWVEERTDAREAGQLKGLQLRRVAEYPLSGTESQSVILSIKPAE